MRVLKFGGSSIGTSEKIRNMVNLISDKSSKIVVFSAIEGITNLLSEFVQQSKIKNWILSEQIIHIVKDQHACVIQELISSPNFKEIALKKLDDTISFISKYMDRNIKLKDEKIILAQGEILSSMIIYIYLLNLGIDSALLSSLDFLKINKENEPDYSYIRSKLSSQIQRHLGCKLFITQGFICKDYTNNTDNLGRGGSDYTATIIGNVLGSKEIEIWTDIDGLQNNDPRFVEHTQSIRKLSYDEASELAYFGAKILHPASITPAQNLKIPILIKNTLNPENKGTVVSESTTTKGLKAIAAKDGITTIKLKSARMMQAYGFLRKIFEIFERYQTSVDMLTTSEISVAMTIENTKSLIPILDDLSALGELFTQKNQCIICIVGDYSKQHISVQNIIEGLRDIRINMISFGASANNMTIVVDSENKTEALNLLNCHVLNNVPCLTS